MRHECPTEAPQVCGAPPPQLQMLYTIGRPVAFSAAPMRVYTARGPPGSLSRPAASTASQ